MEGLITSFTYKTLIVNVDHIGGSETSHNKWTISLTGDVGLKGDTGDTGPQGIPGVSTLFSDADWQILSISNIDNRIIFPSGSTTANTDGFLNICNQDPDASIILMLIANSGDLTTVFMVSHMSSEVIPVKSGEGIIVSNPLFIDPSDIGIFWRPIAI